MLLNEFFKRHRRIQEVKGTVAKEEAMIAQQKKEIQALTKQFQTLSDRLEVSKAAPQMVVENR